MASISQTANPAGVASSGGVSTYSGVSIGTASPNRIVVVLVGTEVAAGSINSVTLGGSAMTPGTQGNQVSVYARAFYLAYPTGTTADVAVTFGAATLSTNNHIAVYSVTDAVYSSTGADQSTDMDATDPLTTGSTTIGTGGGMIAVVSGGSGTGGAKTWTNLTEDLDADGGSFSFCTAFSTTAGTATRTCQGTVTGEDGALSYLIFADNTEPTVALNSPADAATGQSLTPTLNFTGTDTDGDAVEYEVQIYQEVATDDFNRADNSSTGMNLGVNWTATVPNSDLGIISNQAYQTADTGDNVAFYSAATLSNDQYAQVTLSTVGDSYSGLIVRANATDYVLGQAVRGSTGIDIYWYNGGTYTLIATTNDVDVTNGDTIRLEAVGSTFSFYKNNVLVISGTNGSAPSSGKAGIAIDLNTDRLDNFSCGDIIVDAFSATDAGFTAGHPFASGVAKDYTVQSSLTASTLYYWRVRAIDPSGSNNYGAWSTARSFTATAGGGTVVQDIIGGFGFIPFAR